MKRETYLEALNHLHRMLERYAYLRRDTSKVAESEEDQAFRIAALYFAGLVKHEIMIYELILKGEIQP